MSLVVSGATLSGLAVAARLARLGHDVSLVSHGEPLGTRWAATTGPSGHAVDAMPQLLSLPATWRDVFKKSGGHLVAELNRAGLQLTLAPPVEHRFPDGTSLLLPAERGAQFHALTHQWGQAAAQRWRDLMDDLDDVWAARRAFGVESPALPADPAERRRLWLDRTLADLADRLAHPHLARMVLDVGPTLGTRSERAPALLATTFVLDRTFGRWQLVDADGYGQRASRLVELLVDRVREQGVCLLQHAGSAADVDCRPLALAPRFRRAPRPAARPMVSHELRDADGLGPTREVVDHTTSGPVTTWLRPVADAVIASTHDHRQSVPDLAWGLDPGTRRAWLRRTPVALPVPAASACSPAGNEPWAELASAALAVYEVHERLTGEDCRPTNRAFTTSRLARKS